ncbi:hypothetical protein LTR10_001827 [Elasticomyces elasticus]|nr:hypothetical protein LTR10_001827 [Elasticomyces elasticus]KAK4975325.1 hypothetical protein LTR42_004535 [Elasticomyces elasticus]
MFAPPPLQFSKAEIERLKQEALARLQEKRQSTESAASQGSPSKASSSPSSSPKPSRRTGIFARSNKIKVSSPIAQDPHTSPVQRDARDQTVTNDTAYVGENGPGIPPQVPFAEQPRKAPVPPKRPARPSEDLLLLPVRSIELPSPAVPVAMPEYSPPPVPDKSPRRRSSSARQSRLSQAERPRSVLADAALNKALGQLRISDNAGLKAGEAADLRSKLNLDRPQQTMSVESKRRSVHGDIMKDGHGTAERKRLSGVQSGKIDKTPKKRASAAATLEATLLELNYPGLKQSRRATEPAGNASAANEIEATAGEPWKRRRKGETMSMLLDAGFFPDEETKRHKKNLNASTHARLPLPLSLQDKDLPTTPNSITSTPTEMYQSGPRSALPPVPRSRKPRKQKRSPLAQIAPTNAKSNSGSRSAEVSPGRLSAIPELASISENTPPLSGATTPVATLIHLRGGSIVTVTPPELTAWQKHVYIQGPIKLPTPAILPRKNSVASLEPFQQAIDMVYQHALVVPRRRSDDAVVEDICEWLDEFGFEDISYQGDVLMIEDFTVDEVEEMDEMGSHEIERFSTPPLEPVASPLEKAVAKEVVAMSKPDPVFTPPVETEEALRARGIARLSQHSSANRKESLTLARQESIVPFAPVPEHSVLPTSKILGPAPAEPTRNPRIEQGGMDWDDDVEEIDEQPTWVARAMARKKQLNWGLSTQETRNPVKKMRRLMATASAIL